MDNLSQRMGWNVLAMDGTANWDGLVGSDKVHDSTIVVYPQSTPSPYNNPDQRMVRRGGFSSGVEHASDLACGWYLIQLTVCSK